MENNHFCNFIRTTEKEWDIWLRLKSFRSHAVGRVNPTRMWIKILFTRLWKWWCLLWLNCFVQALLDDLRGNKIYSSHTYMNYNIKWLHYKLDISVNNVKTFGIYLIAGLLILKISISQELFCPKYFQVFYLCWNLLRWKKFKILFKLSVQKQGHKLYYP